MLRHHVELPYDQRQLAVAGAIEGEGNIAFAALFRLHNVAIIGAELRIVLLDGIEGEHNVLGRHRLAVVEAGLGAQAIDHRGKIRRMADGFRQQSVIGGNLVERGHQQRVIEEVHAARERPPHHPDRQIEIVEGARSADPRHAGLRRARIDIVEILEARRLAGRVKQGERVAPIPVPARAPAW